MRKAQGSNTNVSMGSLQHPQWQDVRVWDMTTVFLTLTKLRNMLRSDQPELFAKMVGITHQNLAQNRFRRILSLPILALAYGINPGCEPLSSMMHLCPEIGCMNMVNPELQLQLGKNSVHRIACDSENLPETTRFWGINWENCDKPWKIMNHWGILFLAT